MNLFKSGRGFRSGLLRLRVWLQDHVFTREVAVHISTDVLLSLLLHPVLCSLGVPELWAVLVVATCSVVLAQAINDYLDKEADV